MKFKFRLTLIVIFLFLTTLHLLPYSLRHEFNSSGETLLHLLCEKLPNAQIKQLKSSGHSINIFEITLLQPLDHFNTNTKKSFKQRIILKHISFSAPIVLITEGYALRENYVKELSKLLNANEIRVEHRYFGSSSSSNLDWKYLNIKQSAADYHMIVSLFKNIYSGKWISTGWSKGGQTALFHRRFYPDDVNVTVAYDAPLNFAAEDPRIDCFFERVGNKSYRNKIRAFQMQVLMRKGEILPLLSKYAAKHNLHFSIGFEKALEYAVLEYQFSFWQYHHISLKDIPGKESSPSVLFNHLARVVSLSSYSDKAMNSPAMYQFATELGYYRYLRFYLLNLLSSPEDYSNFVFAPKNVSIKFNPIPMRDIYHWLLTEGTRIIYIYGSNDPWSACGMMPSQDTDARRFVLKGGNHFTFINSFPKGIKNQILSTINDWLK